MGNRHNFKHKHKRAQRA